MPSRLRRERSTVSNRSRAVGPAGRVGVRSRASPPATRRRALKRFSAAGVSTPFSSFRRRSGTLSSVNELLQAGLNGRLTSAWSDAAACACRLTAMGLLLAAAWGQGFAFPAQAALREEQVIFPGPGWEYADTGTRDLSVLPAGGWTPSDPVWPNLYWQRVTLSIPPSWSSKRVLVRVGACAYFVRAYLNGHLLGSHYGPVTPFEVDMTDHINGSGPNVLMLAVQDWSALLSPSVSTSNNGLQIDHVPDPSIQGPMAYAVWMLHPRLWTQDIRLAAVPNVRVTDVFVRPSVRQSKLDVDVAIRNDDTSAHTVSIDNLVTKWNNSAVEKTRIPSS